MIVVMNDVGKKCLISLLAEFQQGGLRFGQIWANLRFGQKPNLTALFNTDCRRCLSEASVKPHQRGNAYSILLISVAWVTFHRALQSIRSQDPRDKERLGTPADQAVNVGFEREMILNSYTQNHYLVHPLYTWNRW